MDNNNISKEILAGLSPQERELALQILKEYQNKGMSSTYQDLLYSDYKEIPVDIETFLTDDNYLGKAWKDATGKLKLYPFWLEQLKNLFPNNLDTDYTTLLESGARGIGKSEIACGCVGAYLMYRVMCLKNPLEYYRLKPTEKICFAFMNIKLELAEEIAISKFQKTLQMSPWFMNKGRMTQRNNQAYWVPPEPIKIIIGSQSDDVIGQPIYFAFFDEISFIKNQDIDKQKKKAKDMIDTAVGGMLTRFIHNGKNPTLLTVASSKRSEQSFMEEYIKTLSTQESNKVLVVDKPVWEVKPKGTYGDEIFYLALGNKFLESLVIPDNENPDAYRAKGYTILEVPKFFKAKFLEDMDRTLCDIAGISSSSANKYMSGKIVDECINEEYHNPLPDIIECGNDPADKSQYYNFFNMDYVPKDLLEKPLYVHLDMSISGDMTGIAGVWITGKKPTTEGDSGKDLAFRLAFSTSIKAPKGRQISFEKNRNFIRWLKEAGFKVKEITSDTFQSYDLQQQLKAEGFVCSILSVDRVDADHICKPYQYLKSAIYEKRFHMYRSKRLFDEFVDVERNLNTGKVDHTPNCFTGDTKINLLDGRSLTFTELLNEYNSGKINYVYSINEKTNKIEPGLIKTVWCSGETNKLCVITLDNGEQIKCTPEHLFMLRNGSYIEAQELLPEDSLMPLYTRISQNGLNGYRMYYEPFEDKWHYEHRTFAKEIGDARYLVHHKDCNKLNNNPNNLIWVSKERHHELHSNNGTGAYSEEALAKKSKSVKKWHLENKNSEAYRLRNQKLSVSNKAKYRDDFKNATERRQEATLHRISQYFPEVDVTNLSEHEIRSYCTKIQHLTGCHVNYDNAHAKAKRKLAASNEQSRMLKKLFPEIDEEIFVKMFGFEYDTLDCKHKAPWVNRYRKKLYEIKNHSVKSIDIIDVPATKVYDMEIEQNHNFALTAGIFVHNSHKDALDAVCGATFTASKHADEFAYDYGESLDSFTSANQNTEQVTQQQMILDFEEELKKMHDPLTRGGHTAPSRRDDDMDGYAGVYGDMLIW